MPIVTASCGLVQRQSGHIEEIRPGDVIWFPPCEKHWHGASPTTSMTHIVIQGQLDGKAVDWMEKVTGAQYNGELGFNTGLAEAHVRSLISVREAEVGKKEADNANEILGEVLSNRTR